jgi:hypothetical protein
MAAGYDFGGLELPGAWMLQFGVKLMGTERMARELADGRGQVTVNFKTVKLAVDVLKEIDLAVAVAEEDAAALAEEG